VIIFLLAFLLIIGAGFAVGLASLLLAGMLAAIGIISSSFAIAVLNRSATAGFKSLGATGGVAAGILISIVFIYATQLLGRLIREKMGRLSQQTPDENSNRARIEHR
jgi:hypothetical protein